MTRYANWKQGAPAKRKSQSRHYAVKWSVKYYYILNWRLSNLSLINHSNFSTLCASGPSNTTLNRRTISYRYFPLFHRAPSTAYSAHRYTPKFLSPNSVTEVLRCSSDSQSSVLQLPLCFTSNHPPSHRIKDNLVVRALEKEPTISQYVMKV